MSTNIQEPIKTGVVFDRGGVFPAWFIWGGRRYTVREVTQRWRTKNGSETILHLGVTDWVSVFELTFNQETLVWRLRSVEVQGQV